MPCNRLRRVHSPRQVQGSGSRPCAARLRRPRLWEAARMQLMDTRRRRTAVTWRGPPRKRSERDAVHGTDQIAAGDRASMPDTFGRDADISLRPRRATRPMRVHLCAAIVASALIAGAASAQTAPTLQAGAAKVDVTPAPDKLPKGLEGIHDHLFTRAIVLYNGVTRAALISIDAGGISTDTWTHVSQR